MTNRRGNGLLADAYVPLILLPPESADAMLEALGRSGIAAYAVRLDSDPMDSVPASGSAPIDHLYVDEGERDAAERVLRSELPELAASEGPDAPPGGDGTWSAAVGADAAPDGPQTDAPGDSSSDDDVWADLVKRFYEPGDDAGRPAWPDAENVPQRDGTGGTGEDDTDEDDTDEDGPSGRRRGDLLAPDYDDGSDADADGADDGPPAGRTVRPAADAEGGDHYVPPPPPPLPRGDLTGRLAWGGLFGGPAVLLASMLIGARPGWLAFLAVAAFIAGFVVLVVRMGDRASGDNGPDDGAVV